MNLFILGRQAQFTAEAFREWDPMITGGPIEEAPILLGWEWRQALMAHKIGVICKSCSEAIEVEDQYVPGIRGVEMAENLYKPMKKSGSELANRAWRKTLVCGNPGCRRPHNYDGSDLRLYRD
jgi:hypothetical protein